MCSIRSAQKQDIPALAALLAAAFQEDPLYTAVLPDPAKRQAFLQKFMTFRAKYGGKAGRAMLAVGDGAALWLPPQAKMKPTDVIFLGGFSAMSSAGKPVMNQMMALNNFADLVQAETCPGQHWHLAPIAVAPQAQGKGVGSALLTEGLAHIDSRESCYLETQNPANVSLYTRFGFEVAKETVVPGTEVPYIALFRPARK